MATGTFTLGQETIFNSDISSLAAVDRSKMAQRTNARFPLDLARLSRWDSLGTRLPTLGDAKAGIVAASFVWSASSVDSTFFVAPANMTIVGITARIEVTGTDGGAVTAVIKKVASGTDVASGTAVHSGSINLKGTVDTNQTLTLTSPSVSSGNAIGIDFTGTLTSAQGVVTVFLAPAGSSDDLLLNSGVFATSPSYISTGDVRVSTVTKYARFVLQVPPDFETLQSLTIRAIAGMVTSIADASATLDIEVWRVDADGTLGASDICTTSATSINSLTAANKDFILDTTTVVAGDVLDVRLTIAVTDAATVASVIAAIWQLELQADLR